MAASSRRLRDAPVPVWVEAALQVAAPVAVALAAVGWAPTDPRMWAGYGAGLVLGFGLLARWRVTWAFALLLDLAVLVGAIGLMRRGEPLGVVLAARGVAGVVLLLLPASGRHVFGAAPHGDWFDSSDGTEPEAAG